MPERVTRKEYIAQLKQRSTEKIQENTQNCRKYEMIGAAMVIAGLTVMAGAISVSSQTDSEAIKLATTLITYGGIVLTFTGLLTWFGNHSQRILNQNELALRASHNPDSQTYSNPGSE